jgi:hypothetical protein
MRIFLLLILLLVLSLSAENPAEELHKNESMVTDTLDGKFDVSNFLRTKYGFLALPIIITEPAIGYGGGATAFFIHRDPKSIAKGTRGFPSISAVGGFYTGSKSWAVGGGHFGVWNNGNIRYRGGAGIVSANLTYYRNPLLPIGIKQMDFNIKAYGIIQEIIFRLWNSDFFAGGSYGFAHTELESNLQHELPEEIKPDDFKINIGGLGMSLYYDKRDNMFTPNSGIYGGVKFIVNEKFLGSDRSFQRLFTHILLYSELANRLSGGLRLDYQSSFGDVPFFLRPYISLRGIPAMRYQGESTYLAEGEIRWDFPRTQRWSLLAFGGYGEAQPVRPDLLTKQTAYNWGAGFRYLIARLFGLRIGVDVARGPEQWAFYIQFGSSWFRY